MAAYLDPGVTRLKTSSSSYVIWLVTMTEMGLERMDIHQLLKAKLFGVEILSLMAHTYSTSKSKSQGHPRFKGLGNGLYS